MPSPRSRWSPRAAPPRRRPWTGPGSGDPRDLTTRERLRLPVEHVNEVGPLALPNADEDTDATALLVDRVQTVVPGFAVRPATRGPVAALHGALDGIPLAIELATARLDVLRLDGLLEGGLLDLGGGCPTGSARCGAP